VNVISLSGTTGVGENVVTSGLGPGPETPPTPPPSPRRAGGNTEAGERIWRERWRKIHEERQREIEEDRKRWEEPEAVQDDSIVVPGDDTAAVDDDLFGEDEADYTILPVGEGAAVRAMTTGYVRYVHREGTGLCAALTGDDGVRYLYVGLGRPEGEARHVERDDILAWTMTREERDAAVEAPERQQLAAGLPDEWTIDVPLPEAVPKAWPKAIEVLLLGLPAAGILLAIGAPLAAIIVGGVTLIVAARRPS
jgi:hypothetical protein